MYLFCICIILYYFHLPESWFSAAYYVLYSIIIIRVLYLSIMYCHTPGIDNTQRDELYCVLYVFVFYYDRPDVRLVRLVRAAGVGRPEELGNPAGESHRTMIEEDPTLDQHLTVRGGTTRDTAVSTPPPLRERGTGGAAWKRASRNCR